MRPPQSVVDGVLRCVTRHTGRTPSVKAVRPVGGGCINHATSLRMDSGDAFFLKWNDGAPDEFFAREASGLEALRRASALRVPEVLGHAAPGDPGPPWIVLEFVAQGRPDRQYDALLGDGLARLHRFDGGEATFGWEEDNYIGSLPQANDPDDDWAALWRSQRLEPQLERARPHLSSDDLAAFQALFEKLPELLRAGQADGPSLVHGDLWSGNVYPGPDGEPVLVDPAVYRGHREVDLSMADLFGGFGPGFLEAYDHAWPTAAGYPNPRRHVYQLYPLLVHVNLFGRSYVARLRQALAGALG